MFDVHLQLVFYAGPPNSKLLFCKRGIGPYFDDFDEPVGPRGCIESKSCTSPNVNVGWLPSRLVLCNTQLLFCEPCNAPLFEYFYGPVGLPGCVVSKH